VNEFRQYETAVNAFRLEYNALPGDMDNATDYWGVYDSTKKTGTDDGDGNGVIEIGQKTGDTGRERLWGWRHMSLAGIMPGTYTGKYESGWHNGVAPGINVPTIEKNNLIFNLQYVAYPMRGNRFYVHSAIEAKGGSLVRGVTPKEAKQIDTKMDDGMPALGKLMPSHGWKLGTGFDVKCHTATGKYLTTDPSMDQDAIADSDRLTTKYELSEEGRNCLVGYLAIQ
jgi:hypothetical protein